AIADDFGRKAVTRIHRQNRQARRDSVFYLLSKVKLTVPKRPLKNLTVLEVYFDTPFVNSIQAALIRPL
ncbi:hypothetical protein, partial [Leptolyngbya sp. FACHB-541]|uniref:hypothetical protein n=1 Tax=Leptolyngbya sp. FACHB-541 TaxID=2692810 RepID=UPI001A7E776E